MGTFLDYATSITHIAERRTPEGKEPTIRGMISHEEAQATLKNIHEAFRRLHGIDEFPQGIEVVFEDEILEDIDEGGWDDPQEYH